MAPDAIARRVARSTAAARVPGTSHVGDSSIEWIIAHADARFAVTEIHDCRERTTTDTKIHDCAILMSSD